MRSYNITLSARDECHELNILTKRLSRPNNLNISLSNENLICSLFPLLQEQDRKQLN